MSSKKYKLLLGLLTLMASSAFSQGDKGGGYSIYDSSVIPAKRLPQQNEFWNNTYNFPAKPRNMWEIGVEYGAMTESSDVPSVFPTGGFGIHIRKALGYIFSLRAEYINGYAEGQSWQPSGPNGGWTSEPAAATGTGWKAAGYIPGQDYIFYNYKAHIQDLSIEGLITLNNIRFHKEKTGLVFYGGGGIGATMYKTMLNTGPSGGGTYANLFNAIAAQGNLTYTNRKTILDELKNGYGGFAGMQKNNYTTPAQNEAGRRPQLGGGTLKPSGSIIVGVSYKLSNRINIALEDRQTFVKTDLLDGQQYQEGGGSNGILTGDFDSYNYGSLGINFNLGGKSVEPLWWLNPLDYAYSELNNPKHMKLPKPVFDDADGDGVVDQLDREPNTPAGCPVDTHGVSRDTDGDGVPDCKDKQLITPTECQPVDADGVGKCPDPACCTSLKAAMDSLNAHPVSKCPTDYPSLTFKGSSIGLSGDAKALLATTGSKLKDNPTCTITLTGYPGTSKAQQSLAEKRLTAIQKYLVEKLGISADRISTAKNVGGGDANTVDIKSN